MYDRDLRIIRNILRTLLVLTLLMIVLSTAERLWLIVAACTLWCFSYVLLFRYTTAMQNTRDNTRRLLALRNELRNESRNHA